jgi:hypothetical protein
MCLLHYSILSSSVQVVKYSGSVDCVCVLLWVDVSKCNKKNHIEHLSSALPHGNNKCARLC